MGQHLDLRPSGEIRGGLFHGASNGQETKTQAETHEAQAGLLKTSRALLNVPRNQLGM